jgi:hypothetical protein
LPLSVGNARRQLHLSQCTGQGKWAEPAASKQIASEFVGPGFIIEMLRFAEQSRCVAGARAIAEVA